MPDEMFTSNFDAVIRERETYRRLEAEGRAFEAVGDMIDPVQQLTNLAYRLGMWLRQSGPDIWPDLESQARRRVQALREIANQIEAELAESKLDRDVRQLEAAE